MKALHGHALGRAVVALALASVVLTGGVVGAAAETERTGRLAGSDRFETAVAISRHGFPDGASVVYIARGDVYVDAVVGGMLSDGPILLVRSAGAPPRAVLEEVDRLGATKVVALGGPRAVAPQVLADVARGRATSRLAGPDRYATAVAISRHAFPAGGPGTAIFATDATQALVAAANTDLPVLLLPPGGPVPDVVGQEIHRLGVGDARLVLHHGPTIRALEAWAFEQERQGRPSFVPAVSGYGGTIDDAQQILVRDHFTSLEVPRLYVGRSDDPVDAIAAGAAVDGPVVLVPPCTFTPVGWWIAEWVDPARVHALGGPRAVCDDVLRSFGAIARDPYPPAPGPVDLDVDHVGPPLAWSADGSTLVAAAGYVEAAAVDTATGSARRFEILEGWIWELPEPHTVAVASDGSVVWLGLTLEPRDSWSDYRQAIVAHFPDGSRSPRPVVDGSPLAARGAAMVVASNGRWDEAGEWQQDLAVHDLERGTSWTLPDLTEGRYVHAVSPRAEYVLVGDREQGPTWIEVWYRDGRQELLLPQHSGRCGPIGRWGLDVSADLATAVWSRNTTTGSCSTGAWSSHAVVEDVKTGDVRPLAYRDSAVTPSSTFGVTDDGRTALIVVTGEFLVGPDGEPSYLTEDGPRLDGLPPLDGESHGFVAVDLTRPGDPAAYELLPTHPELPHGYDVLAGPRARSYAWHAYGVREAIRIRRG